MCGVAGFTHSYRPADQAAQEAVIRRMTGTLHHRGPDQQGCYSASGIALGAVRLQVIDLQGGEQPLRSADGSAVIVYNGEIFNFAEIRRELESRGRLFQS